MFQVTWLFLTNQSGLYLCIVKFVNEIHFWHSQDQKPKALGFTFTTIKYFAVLIPQNTYLKVNGSSTS